MFKVHNHIFDSHMSNQVLSAITKPLEPTFNQRSNQSKKRACTLHEMSLNKTKQRAN